MTQAPVDAQGLVAALADWFAANARRLPWRGPIGHPRDPYAVLVSEAMLQQTQASRVAELFPRFMTRFPTVQALAAAEERDVLALWSGLGYYRRARLLHGAARAIVETHGGNVPRDHTLLMSLPGVGRYTAGAIASIAFGDPAPIVDGNVARVLLRVHGRAARTADRATQAWLWERAGELVQAAAAQVQARGPGVVNEAMMELGATVCVPAPGAARCEVCPLARICVARREGSQARIPAAKEPTRKRTIHCASAVVRDARGRVLLECRASNGMWAGLWQAPTLERDDRAPTRAELARSVGVAAATLTARGAFTHQTTHRCVEFTVYAARAERGFLPRRGAWAAPVARSDLGMSSAQKRVLALAGAAATTPTRSP